MSDSFDTPFSSSESSSLVSDIVKPLTIRKKVEELQVRASDNTNPWSPERRNTDPKMGLDTFSGLFVYVCLSFIPTHLIRKKECRPDYPDGWYHADGRRITISHTSAFAEFFLDGTPKKRDTGDDLTDTGVKLYTAIVQKEHPSTSDRWLAALGLLLAFDEGRGRGGKRFNKGQELEREEIEREASSLTVQYNGQTCSNDFVASVLEIYATKICGAILEKKETCPHCGEQKIQKKPCPHCGIIGDSWTCPSCGTKTAVADIPKHGTTRMSCPSCGIPVIGAGQFKDKLQNALQLPPDKGLEKLKALQLEYHAAVGFEASWEKLNAFVDQLAAATAALDKIANAINEKKLSDAETLLKSARLKFPDLNYSQFERQIADLKKEEERRKRQKRELGAAHAAIQSAIDNHKYDLARKKVDETSRRNLAEFQADEWRRKIKAAEIDYANAQYIDALNRRRWEDATTWAQKRVQLGDGEFKTYEAEIGQRKAKRREKLEEACTNAIDDFKRNYPANLAPAAAALERAEIAVTTLGEEFSDSPRISSTKKDIENGRREIAKKRRDNTVNDLRPVQSLIATGSKDGKPTITISWKPGIDGTPVAKWRLVRMTRAGGGVTNFPDIDGSKTSFEDRGSDLKLGVEYFYEITPMAKIGMAFEENKRAVVRSGSVDCVARLATEALTGSGMGIEGVRGIVNLEWTLPPGIAGTVRYTLMLSRHDKKIDKLDVADKNGTFIDKDVSVGTTYRYTLSLSLCGKDCGTSQCQVTVKKLQPPSPVSNLHFSGKDASGRTIVQWDWPKGVNVCVWALVPRRVSSYFDIAASDLFSLKRETYLSDGGIHISSLSGESDFFVVVFAVYFLGEMVIPSPPSLRTFSNTVIRYSIKNRSWREKNQPTRLILESSTGYIPELELHASHARTDVFAKSGGRIVARLPQRDGCREQTVPLAGIVSQGEFVRLFLVSSDTENCVLIHPSEFEVK